MTIAQTGLQSLQKIDVITPSEAVDVQTVKAAMRNLAGGVSVVTAGIDEDRTGATVTSATALSMDPPTMIVNINLNSSTFAVIDRYRHFCVNILSQEQQAVAERFSGFGGIKGADRYEGASWTTLASGAPALVSALAAIDCEVDEVIVRHSHAIILGRILSVTADKGHSLVYSQGRYSRLSV